MTLLREIMLVVVVIFLALFSANFILTVLESRNYLETQLQAHAQDTATSLGLSMTTAMADADNANLELLASAVFDRGYYSEIKLTSIDGEVLVHRSNSLQVDGVPDWFADILDLPNPEGRSEISRGWIRLGELSVRAHPGNAYRDLWRITRDFAYLFGIIVVLSYGLFGLVISFVMRPLRAVEAQANDICERQFAIVEQVPKTRELKRVVEAMNRMSTKIKAMFENQLELTERLRFEAKTDAVTGLNNKQEFDALVSAALQSEQGAGSSVLMLLQIRDFAKVNERLGFAEADDLLAQTATRMRTALNSRDEAILCRRGGADFAVFIPHINLEHARISLERTFQEIASLQLLTEPEFASSIHMAAVFAEQSTTISELFTEADAGLRNAQASSSNSTEFIIHGNRANPVTELVKQASEWRTTLMTVITKGDFLFHYQPIYRLGTEPRELLADEVFVRIQLDGDVVSAGAFIPMAERFGLLVELDQLIIERALTSLDESAGNSLVLNLSTYSLQNYAFREWFFEALQRHADKADRVMFELQEHAIHLSYQEVKTVIDLGNSLGYRFSVDHFGTSSTSFAYLQSMDLASIKIDRSFVSDIDQQTDNQFFVQSVVQIAQARDMLVIAEGVEREEELEVLESMNVDAAMGYLLGRPGPEISLT